MECPGESFAKFFNVTSGGTTLQFAAKRVFGLECINWLSDRSFRLEVGLCSGKCVWTTGIGDGEETLFIVEGAEFWDIAKE